MAVVHKPGENYKRLSPHYSRRVNKPTLIVLHDVEGHDHAGVADLKVLGEVFYRNRVSAHIGVDGEGLTGRYVEDWNVAWHCQSYNAESLGIEQFGFASFTALMWKRNNRAQLKKVAKWIAWWSEKYGIPIQKAEVRNGYVVKPGVTTHNWLRPYGGTHIDPGPNYPFWLVLRMARYYKRYGW